MMLILVGVGTLVAAAAFAPARAVLDRAARPLDRWIGPLPLLPDRGERAPAVPDNDGAACLERLADLDALDFAPMSAFSNDEGCGTRFPVMVKAVGSADISGRGVVLSCAAAERLGKWLTRDVSSILNEHDKHPITQVHHMGSYNCRKIGGSNRWSQHAFANAIDIGGFTFEDGERLSIQDDWGDQPVLKALARSACRRFNVVLSPAYNEAHSDHLHLDVGADKTCS